FVLGHAFGSARGGAGARPLLEFAPCRIEAGERVEVQLLAGGEPGQHLAVRPAAYQQFLFLQQQVGQLFKMFLFVLEQACQCHGSFLPSRACTLASSPSAILSVLISRRPSLIAWRISLTR